MRYPGLHEDRQVWYVGHNGYAGVRTGIIDRIYQDSADVLDTEKGIVTVDKSDIFLSEREARDAACKRI